MGGTAQLEVGEVFAERYKVERLLGEGDRKRTYLAKDAKTDRLVAISVVRPEAVLSDPGGTEREARVFGRIGSHPNIVSLYDYEIGKTGSIQYIVFQYLGGGTLTEYLRQTGQWSLDDLLRLGRQLCRGLSHLHARGLIHRDVSPDNVWLDERHVAHLGDFDSAIAVTATDADADADELRPITTGAFAAPEELEGGSLDARSDLFSLGGVLYVIATGAQRPGDLQLLRSQRPDLPSSFGDLVASLLSDSPDDRPTDTGSVLQRLDEVRHASKVDALIEAGESDVVEYKSSLHHRYDPLLPPKLQNLVEQQTMSLAQAEKEVRKLLNTAITKTVAAFLNTNGGTLLIGVSDSGTVVGIEPDFEYLRPGKKDFDGWLLSLEEVIHNALIPGSGNAIRASLVRHGQQTVAVVQCRPRTHETWHRTDGGETFYVRASNATRELHGSDVVRYIRERWPA
jgi:serine/threonine protein kinase